MAANSNAQKYGAVSQSLLDIYRAEGIPEADIERMVKEREGLMTGVPKASLLLHPYNVDVFNALILTQACFVMGMHGGFTGYHYADANAVMDWHDTQVTVRKRLSIAVNAILRG